MTKPRTLGDALSPEQARFLSGENESSTNDRIVATLNNGLDLPDDENLNKEDHIPLKATVRAVVALNVRINPEIAAKLKRISRKREDEGIKPCTQREIVEEALTVWLGDNPN